MKKYIPAILFSTFLLLSLAALACATPEYARQTGLMCSRCHIDATGGGPLTPAGQTFLAQLKMRGLYSPPSLTERIMRVITGYVHLLTAIIWFGTILYVHVLLKPTYAAKGLPRGELLLGWASIIIMATSGTLLAIMTMPSWRAFYTTRLGILLSIKIFLFLIMTGTAAVVTFYVGPKMKAKMKRQDAASAAEETDFSIEELRAFDGREGRAAYIAFKGNVYDVTASRLWKDGSHLRKHSAGGDLTEILKTAPHGEEKILSMRRIGRVRSGFEGARPFYERVFYLFAYMNLVIVFLIVFVIALMRWGD